MATEQHKRLAEIVKGTHAKLRAECQRYGADVAWMRHIARNEVLREYATSMQELATKCWTTNNVNSEKGTHCRVEWIRNQCKEYFFNGGREKYDERERDISAKMTAKESPNPRVCEDDGDRTFVKGKSQKARERVSLLDVGSCYNPFGDEDMFDVTAIDLISATNDVLQCDFLNVAIGEERILSEDQRKILQLPADSFDAVVFSLLLEYLPCPRQRYICCRNAYNVLKNSGLLIIVSPDSKHAGANAKLMKSWRYTLSKLGFMRIKYEKLRHLHCLAFRKCVCKDVAGRWVDLQRFSEDEKARMSEMEIFIPQDFQNVSSNEKQENMAEYDETDLMSTFSELPFNNGTFNEKVS